MVDFEKLLYI